LDCIDVCRRITVGKENGSDSRRSGRWKIGDRRCPNGELLSRKSWGVFVSIVQAIFCKNVDKVHERHSGMPMMFRDVELVTLPRIRNADTKQCRDDAEVPITSYPMFFQGKIVLT